MMRFHFPLSVFLAGLFVLPKVGAQGQDGPTDLRRELAQTVAAIESLHALQAELSEQGSTSIETLLGMTERPIMADRERDEFLTSLRNEVSGLQMAVDAIDSGASQVASSGAPVLTPSATPTTSGNSRSAQPGPFNLDASSTPDAPAFSPELQRALNADPVETRPAPQQPVQRQANDGKRDFETRGFSANRLRQGKLLYQARQFANALDVFRSLDETVETRYWTARCLEKTGDQLGAIELYRALSEQSESPAIAKRAASDLDFLTWQRDFYQRLEDGKQQ